jgi:hypothetical protein
MQARNIAFGRAVRVFWNDSRSYHGWQYKTDHLGTPGKIVTQGYIAKAKKDDGALVVTTSIGTTGAIIDPLEIPWGAIAQIEYLPREFDRNSVP